MTFEMKTCNSVCTELFLDNFETLEDNSFLNNDYLGLQWTVPPQNQNGPCQVPSVLRLLPPVWAKGAQINLTFSDVGEGWIFNLGDSAYNNGYGGMHT